MVTQTIRFAKNIFAGWIFVVLTTIFAGSARCGADLVPADAGFARPEQNLFAPALMLAPPGPDSAAHALDAFARQLAFQRKISFHPELSPELKSLLEVLPPRQSTLIRAPALYSRRDIGWIDSSSNLRMIAVDGAPRDASFDYGLARGYQAPESPQHFAGVFALAPARGEPPADPSSVIGRLGGELLMDTYGGGELVDAVAKLVAECRGDLAAPWDTAPGEFNHHDRAALDRIRRDLPRFAAKIDETLEFHNVLDEFNSKDGAYVLANVDAEMRPAALKKYPLFENFWKRASQVVDARSTISDYRGNSIVRTGFNHGHILMTFVVRHGLLTPFNDALAPAGDGIALDAITSGRYRTSSSVHLKTLGMNLGLDNLEFSTLYKRTSESVSLQSTMASVPQFVAPIGIHQIVDLIANDFITVLATGNGGLASSVECRATGDGRWRYAGEFAAEFHYAPALEFLARIGDALADANNDRVRAQEREFFGELFDAMAADYNDARPKLLAESGAAQKSK